MIDSNNEFMMNFQKDIDTILQKKSYGKEKSNIREIDKNTKKNTQVKFNENRLSNCENSTDNPFKEIFYNPPFIKLKP